MPTPARWDGRWRRPASTSPPTSWASACPRRTGARSRAWPTRPAASTCRPATPANWSMRWARRSPQRRPPHPSPETRPAGGEPDRRGGDPRCAPADKSAGTVPGAGRDRIEIFDPNALAGEGRKVRDIQLRPGRHGRARTVTMPAPGRDGPICCATGAPSTVRCWPNARSRWCRPRSRSPQSRRSGRARAMTVEWIGPGARHDDIELWDPQARGGEGKKLFEQAPGE